MGHGKKEQYTSNKKIAFSNFRRFGCRYAACETIISLDVGTSNAKAVLFDIDGKELLVKEHSFALSTPQEGWSEQDGEEVIEASYRVLEEIVLAHPTLQSSPPLLSVSTQGGSFIPVTAKGIPLHPIISWMDSRASGLLEEWKNNGTYTRVRELSGWWPQTGLPLLTISWFRRHKPEIFAQTELYLSLSDFLSLRLCGRAVTDPSNAGEMLLADRSTGEWSDELCAIAGVKKDQLAEIAPAHALVERLTEEASENTGLPQDTWVVNGGQDHSCELFAIGSDSPEEALLACGTAWVINGVSDTSDLDSIPAAMDLNFHVLPKKWTISQFLGPFGADFNWLMRQCYSLAGERDFPSMERETAEAMVEESRIPQRPLYVPLSGPSQVDGADTLGGFCGLGYHHGREDMILAAMEGAAFEVRWAVEKLRDGGFPLHCLWMVGGAVKNPHWPKIVADVTGIEVRLISYSHGPALGAAILACIGAGICSTAAEAKERFSVSHSSVEPDPQRHELYTEKFEGYKEFARFKGAHFKSAHR